MATKTSTSDRSSITANNDSGARPPCSIHSMAVVGDKVQITGTHSVEIGENSVVHPYVRIKAERGKVTIGRNCTVGMRVVLGVSDDGDGDGGGGGDVWIGDGVNIETGAVVEAESVGEGTVIEVNTRIGKEAVIGKHCKISPLNEVQPHERIPDYTVIYGYNQRRRDQTMASNPEVVEAKQKGQQMHIELLKRLIPDASAKWK